MSQNQSLQDYLNQNFPQNNENQQQQNYQNYSSEIPSSQVQSIPPQNYSLNPQIQNPQIQNNNPFLKQPQTFMEKVNSTASEVFDFLKSKTENISIPKNPLIKIDYSQNLIPINEKNFEEDIKKDIFEINCLKIEKGKLNELTIISLIQNPRVINDSIFKTNYVLYEIITQQMNWCVTRRYSDFLWLRETLQSSFPGELIPVLPKKKIGNRRFDKDFIEKRSKGLQNFLNNVLLNEKLKSSENVLTFLSCVDRNYFEQQKKLFNPNILKPPFINQIKTFEGKIKLVNFENIQNSNTNNHFGNINNFLKCQNETLQIIKKNLKQFYMNVSTACINLDEVEKGFKKLNEISIKVKLSNKICNVYEQYEIFFKNWKRLQINQTCVIKDVVNGFFKDVKGKCQSLSDLISIQENMKEDYLIRTNKLNLKKESLWNQMDIKKWELNQMENIDMTLMYRDKNYAMGKMCYKETNDLKNIKGFIQFYFYQNFVNFKKLFEEFEKSYIDNLQDFCDQIQPNITDAVTVWSHLSSNIRIE